ncbi:MAG: hypothetical protein GY758_29860 [Fuerstiella sp.]|nr:hypothetical protein [Fuerstiella sp.]
MKHFLCLLVIASYCGSVAAESPRVLIIGDSISLGYTPHVKRLLQNEAEVVHNRGNAEHSGTGIKQIDNWLGDTKWDVIHFNWGLWDLCYRHPESKVQGRRDKIRGTLTTSLAQYEENVDALVARLKETGATLIWANTTVVPEGERGRKVNDDLKYNDAAARVMKKHGVKTNDLNRLTRTFTPGLFTKPGDVHFKPAGYQQLAEQVVASIRGVLPQRHESAVVSRIMFGSCIKQDRPMPILETIADQNPEVFIFLGDNIYGDTEDMDVLRAKYERLGSDTGFQRLRTACPILATWDDHDFGVNDGGADYPKRMQSERIFEEFWFGDSAADAHAHPGVYDAHVFGPSGQRVQVILLDTRYFRSPLKRGEKRVGGPWLPDEDPTKTMLGDAQWNWLETQLLQPADVRIIASSIQFIAEDAGQETWSNLPRERQKMLDLLAATKANGVVFISGDRHWSELSALDRGTPDRLLDLTSSSFNQIHPRGTPTENRFREIPRTYHKENYGVINIAWEQPTPLVTLEIRDLKGDVQLSYKVRLP